MIIIRSERNVRVHEMVFQREAGFLIHVEEKELIRIVSMMRS